MESTKVREMLNKEEARRVLDIPLSVKRCVDLLVWFPNLQRQVFRV